MESQIQVLLVEDMPFQGEAIKKALINCNFEVFGPFVTAEDALEFVEKNEPAPDVALVDITLDGHMDGIDLAHRLESQYDIGIIFLSDRTDDNTKSRVKGTNAAFFSKSADYIISEIELSLAVEDQVKKIKASKSLNEPSEKIKPSGKIAIHRNSELLYLEPDNLIMLESSDDSATAYYTDEDDTIQRYRTRKKFKDMLVILQQHGDFRQVHRSYIVNMKYVVSMNKKQDQLIFNVALDPVDIGRGHKQNLKDIQSL